MINLDNLKRKDNEKKERNIYRELDRSLLITSIVTSLLTGGTIGSISSAFYFKNKENSQKEDTITTPTPDTSLAKAPDIYINDDYLLEVYEHDYKLKVNYKGITDKIYVAKANNKKENKYFLAYDIVDKIKKKKKLYSVYSIPDNNYQFSVNSKDKIVIGPKEVSFERLGSLGENLLTYSNSLKIDDDYLVCSKRNIDTLLKRIAKDEKKKSLVKEKKKKMR